MAYLLLPLFFSGAFVTAYEVLQARFGGVVQRAASVLFVSTRTLADGLRLYLTAIVVQEMTGLAARDRGDGGRRRGHSLHLVRRAASRALDRRRAVR